MPRSPRPRKRPAWRPRPTRGSRATATRSSRSFAPSASNTRGMPRRRSLRPKPAKSTPPPRSCPASRIRSSAQPTLDSPGRGGQAAKMDADPTSDLSFEAALQRLEEIVRLLEKGEAPLDQSIELYQEGDRLKRHCEARLKAAQARIEQIAFGADGKPSGTTPFDGS